MCIDTDHLITFNKTVLRAILTRPPSWVTTSEIASVEDQGQGLVNWSSWTGSSRTRTLVFPQGQQHWKLPNLTYTQENIELGFASVFALLFPEGYDNAIHYPTRYQTILITSILFSKRINYYTNNSTLELITDDGTFVWLVTVIGCRVRWLKHRQLQYWLVTQA